MSEVIRLKHRGNKAYIEGDPRGHDVIHVLGFGDDRNEEICGEFVNCVNEHDSLVARIQVLEEALRFIANHELDIPCGHAVGHSAHGFQKIAQKALSSSVVSAPLPKAGDGR